MSMADKLFWLCHCDSRTNHTALAQDELSQPLSRQLSFMASGSIGDAFVIHYSVGPTDQGPHWINRAAIVVAEKRTPLRAFVGDGEQLLDPWRFEIAADMIGDARVFRRIEREHGRPSLVHLR
jgi:hypothetical protein